MPRILLTSGPTREYLDPVRYLTNASSGRMGAALAETAIDRGFEVVIVSGPVDIEYPPAARVVPVLTTEEMLDAAIAEFPTCDGVIGVAAPCDFRPVVFSDQKLKKQGNGLQLDLVETPDILAALGRSKREGQWIVSFALETDDPRNRAIEKLKRKRADLIVLNGPAAIDAVETSVELIDPEGETVAHSEGPKSDIARQIVDTVVKRFLPQDD